MRIQQVADHIRFPRMTTEELREAFLVTNIFKAGEIQAVYVDLDRAIVGSAVPTDQPLILETDDMLKASYFTERRELGILNIGAPGVVCVNDHAYELATLDGLYIGSGNEHISFQSSNAANPAEFYLLSYPAHASYPTIYIPSTSLQRSGLGSPETANQREIHRMIHTEGPASCQLVMGFTRMASGSVWNTMPPHTHMRRSEIYLYFGLPADERVIHLMGPSRETRHMVVANKQAIISPGWSIHAGVGTRNYTFCWGMGGENKAYADMDPISIAELL